MGRVLQTSARASSRLWLTALVVGFAALGVSLLGVTAAHADDCVSGVDLEGECKGSLTEAISDVDADSHTIHLAADSYTVTATLVINTGEDATIIGAGAATTTIVADGVAGPVFSVAAGAILNLQGVTVSGGDGTEGGGLTNAGTVTLTTAQVTSNQAELGGGIYNAGTLTLTDSTVSSNTAVGGATPSGGGIYNTGTATLTGGQVTGNHATSDDTSLGGGIYNAGTLSLDGVEVTSNDASGTTALGGGVYNASGTATVDGGAVESNTAGQCGGAFYVADGDVTVERASFSANDAEVDGDVFYAVVDLAVDASPNWWGDVAGPPDGSNAGEGVVTVDPWCTAETCSALSSDTPPDDTPPVEPAPPPTNTEEVDGLTVTVDPTSTPPPDGGPLVVGDENGTLEVTPPDGTPDDEVSGGPISDLDDLADQAPPPPGSGIIDAWLLNIPLPPALPDQILDAIQLVFSALLSFLNNFLSMIFGELTDLFGPLFGFLSVVDSHAATVLPPDRLAETLVLAYWDGTQWVEVGGASTTEAGDEIVVSGHAPRSGVFALLYQPGRGAFTTPPSQEGVTLTRWLGGDYEMLTRALPSGGSVWVLVDGDMVGYVAGAPDFVNAPFMERYPAGLANGTAVVIAR